MKETDRRGRNREHRASKTILEGILAAAEWDRDGAVTRIRLLATDESEYAIENGESFLNLTRKFVRVSGTIQFSSKGAHRLWVRKCTLLETPMEEDGFFSAETL